jgi:hypothetical protein
MSTYTAFVARFFVAGFVETDRLPSSLSADLFRRIPVALMTFARGFLWKLYSSSSSRIVIGVVTVEPVLLLGKGIGETLVDVVEARSATTFALYLAKVPKIRARLMLSGQKWTVVYSQGRWTRENKVVDEVD